jgi:hypothetical protein
MSIEIKPLTEEDLNAMMAEHQKLCPDLEVRDDIREAILRYVEHRILPGDFLYAVLTNDLRGAFGRADSYNRASLFQIVQFCHCEIPASCWGSVEKVSAWVKGEE